MPRIPFSDYRRQCFAELLGTYLLVFCGPASVILTANALLAKTESLVIIATTFALVVGIMILLLGEHSGAVINPAVLIAALVSRTLKKELFLPYVIFQIFGGLLAGATLKILFSSFDTTDLGSTKLASGVGPIEGIVIELVGTFLLSSSALLAGKLKKDLSKAALVGVTLFFLILAFGPLTGASLNPARSLGPALASGYLNNLYVYLVGPCAGGLAAGILFKSVGDRIERKDTIRLRS